MFQFHQKWCFLQLAAGLSYFADQSFALGCFQVHSSQLSKQVWVKPVCFPQILLSVLQNQGIKINNLRRNWLKTPTSETSYYSSVSIELDLERTPASLTEVACWPVVFWQVFSFLFKISLRSFSGGWYGTKALQGLLKDDLTAFTYLRKRNSGSDFSGLNCSRSLWSNIWRTSLSSPEK